MIQDPAGRRHSDFFAPRCRMDTRRRVPLADWAVSSLTFFDQCPYRHSDYSGRGCIEDKAMRPAHMAPLNPNPEVTEGLLEISPKAMMQSEACISPFHMAAALNVRPSTWSPPSWNAEPVVNHEGVTGPTVRWAGYPPTGTGYTPRLTLIPEVGATALVEWGVKRQLHIRRHLGSDVCCTWRQLASLTWKLRNCSSDQRHRHQYSTGRRGGSTHSFAEKRWPRIPTRRLALFLLDQDADIETAGDGPILRQRPACPPQTCRRPLNLGTSSVPASDSSKLVELGADTQFEDQDGRTALHLAVWRGDHPRRCQCLPGPGA